MELDPRVPEENGLGHDGGPAEPEAKEEENEVEESAVEHLADEEFAPKVVRVPRVPTRREREIHEALHIPHAEWCEFCVRGRARNKPHSLRTSSSNKRRDIEGDRERRRK